MEPRGHGARCGRPAAPARKGCMFAPSPYRVSIGLIVALAVAVVASAQNPVCRSGPLPENPDNRIVLCSPDPHLELQLFTTTTVVDHSHTLTVRSSDIHTPPDSVTYTTDSQAGHTHDLTLSRAQLNTLANGSTLVVTTKRATAPRGHTHSVTIHDQSVRVRILDEGLELTWEAPPRVTTAYVSPILASNWVGVDSLAEVSGLQLQGAYLAFRDRRLELSLQSIDSLGTGRGNHGVVGRDRIKIAWNSRYEGSATTAIAGVFDIPATYGGEGLRFEVPNRNPQFPADTTVAAGLRLHLRTGDSVRRGDSAFFDLEDWEGYHVWRWGADPTSPNYESVGEYSKLRATASPDTIAWHGVRPASQRILFLDRNVFDGFTYHYAISAYDQGFRRATSGQDLAVKFESPLELATTNPSGGVTLGLTQIRVEFRREPPAEFRAIAAVPNPFRNDAVDATREETTKVSFINAPPRGILYIFTLAGDLVFQREHDLPTIGTIDWDTRNQTSHEEVASGVYIYKIVDLVSGEQSYGRLAIIR